MGKENFFSNLLGNIFKSNDPNAIKKRALKNIAKDLSKTKYHFYKPNSNEVEPAFAKQLYEIYKIISPVQLMFQNLTPAQTKLMVLEAALTNRQKELIDSLTEDALKEFSRGKKIEEIREKVNKDLQELTSGIDNQRVIRIDALYTKFVCMSAFCTYDFYFILKKFDPTIRERNFNSTPNFKTINGTYILEDLKNFIAVAWALPFESDWEDVFRMLKLAKGIEPITFSNWKKVLSRLRPLKDRDVIEMMIRLISQNPTWNEMIRTPEHKVFDDYILDIKKTATTFLDDLQAKQTAGKVETLLNSVFGTTKIDELHNYNQVLSAVYEKKNLGGFEYADPLSYVKYFINNYTKKEMRDISDILLVRAEWTNQQLATPMSESYHQIIDLGEKISILDNRIAENADLGIKIKTYMPRAERDREARNIIQMIINDINEEAGKYILIGIKEFVVFDRNLKMLLEDFVKPHPEIILNWKDLDRFAEGKLKEICVDCYKRIYYLVSLLQTFDIDVELDSDDDSNED